MTEDEGRFASGSKAGEASHYERVANKRAKFLSPALETFTAYEHPLLVSRGEGQYLFDNEGRRYLDCVAQNVCITVGYNHPVVTAEATRQLESIQHCTTLFYHEVPALYAEELVERMPDGEDWVVHFVNSGSEAIDLALLMSRAYTGNFEVLSLRNSYHGVHFVRGDDGVRTQLSTSTGATRPRYRACSKSRWVPRDPRIGHRGLC